MKIHDRKICANCPKRDANGLCYIKATTSPPAAPMCEYGLKISAEWRERDERI
jgi:hypothetical protein